MHKMVEPGAAIGATYHQIACDEMIYPKEVDSK
jgi:hypothetical protein